MNDIEIQDAVVEALPSILGICKESGDVVRWLDEEGIHCEDCDLLNDLNMVHEAMLFIGPIVLSNWSMELRRIIVRDCKEKELDGVLSDFWFYNATARQRWEAFLRTVGKWKD